MMFKISICTFLVAIHCFHLTLAAQEKKKTRDEQVIEDREKLSQNENWIYDDLDKAIEVAQNENKPLMVVLRCIP
jgi:hypothetical protein